MKRLIPLPWKRALALCLLARLVVVCALWGYITPRFGGDALQYYGLAQSLAESGFTEYAFEGEEFRRPPVMPAAGALVVLALPDAPVYTHLVVWVFLQALMWPATIGLVLLTARRLGLRPNLWAVVVLCALDLPAHYAGLSFGSDCLYALLFAASCYLCIRSVSWRGFLLAGVLAGLAAHTRPIGMYWPLLMVVIVAWLSLSVYIRPICYALGVVLVVAALHPLSVEVSQAHVYFGPVTAADAIRLDKDFMPLRLERAAQRPPPGLDGQWVAEQMKGAVARNLHVFPLVAAQNIPRVLFSWPWPPRKTWLAALSDLSALACYAFAFAVCWRVFRRKEGRRFAVLLFLAPVCYHLALSWGPDATPRYRLPFYPWLVVLASCWLPWSSIVRQKQWRDALVYGEGFAWRDGKGGLRNIDIEDALSPSRIADAKAFPWWTMYD